MDYYYSQGKGKMKTLVIASLLLLVGVAAQAQTTTQTLRIQWDIEGPQAPAGTTRPPFDTATAQSYTYKVYIVGAAIGMVIQGPLCTTTPNDFIKTCAATLPPTLDIPGTNLDMTVTVDGIETAHSEAATVPPLIIPPTPPTNLRLQRILLQTPPPGGIPNAIGK